MRTEKLIAGELNIIHIQVHNTGWDAADPVEVRLYFADTTGTPARAPDLPGGFWGSFPSETLPWQFAGSASIRNLNSGQPVVARIQWTPPANTGSEVALLAICTHNDDDLLTTKPDGSLRTAGDPNPPLVVDPRAANSLVEEDRRVALLVTQVEVFSPDPFVRDGIDDMGQGAVAWGGRSSDIVVLEESAALALGDLNTSLQDLSDRRLDDRLKGSDNHLIYVRVHNRRKLFVSDVSVNIFAMQLETIHDPASWISLGSETIITIVPEGWLFTTPVVWNNPVDPNSDSSYKVWLIAAIIGMTDPDGPDDEAPDHTALSTVQEFWRFFLNGERNNNATLRALRWIP